jgi:hypothetical protein
MTPRSESPLIPCPDCGQPRESREFWFDHEAQDSARDTGILQMLEDLGIELGAQVTVWYCVPCDNTEAIFVYPEQTRGIVEYTMPPTNRIPPHQR